MTFVAKALEAFGIACVMIGLVQGIQSTSMWMELYLSIIGIVLFLAGWGIEKWGAKKRRRDEQILHPAKGQRDSE
jgi:hypothetical protein